ncbi:MAG: energy transducer TonB [bacterium]|nr:energy transducer TonB [bacterium]
MAHCALAGAIWSFMALSSRPSKPYQLDLDMTFSSSSGGQASQSVAQVAPQPQKKKRPVQPKQPTAKPPAAPKEEVEAVATAPGTQRPEPSGPTEAEAQPEQPEKDPEQEQRGLRRNYVKAHGRHLAQAIRAHFDYPELARSRGWSGKVLVAVLIGTNGTVRSIELVRSSGFELLDHSALKTLRAIKQLPAPPKETRLILPISFKLQG